MASNPYVNKVQYGSTVLVDLTADTVTAASMLSGVTAHAASGATVTGTIENGDLLGYGSSSYLIGTAKVGTGYIWTDYSGEICIAGKSVVGEGHAA